MWGLMMVLAVIVSCTSMQLTSRLRKLHHELWETLGRPRFNLLPGTRSPYWKFVLERQYRSLDDVQLRRIAGRLRIVSYAVVFAFFAAFLVAFVDGLRRMSW